ncbi:MAG: hypothetical protein AAB388_01205 [Patescibacteria group bacterium]
MKKRFVVIFIIIPAIVAAAVYWLGGKDSVTTVPPPPDIEEHNDWLTYSDYIQRITFRYPEVLPTKYQRAIDWPPHAQVLSEPFACVEAGEDSVRAGRTERRLIGSREYCRTSVVEGAAGSIYTQYAYAFPHDDSTVILTFSTQVTQCGNYDGVERKTCEAERATFAIDVIIDQIAETFTDLAENTTDGRSGIKGTVLLGPTCPVVSDPPDPQCADRPYQTKLVVTTSDQSQVIKEFSSAADGTFSVDLPPGEYAIRSAAAANILPYCAYDMFEVNKDSFTDLTIACESGIR